MEIEVYLGDCLDVLSTLPIEGIHLVYIDPPFGTQRQHRLSTRDRTKEYTFNDCWKSLSEYRDFLTERLRVIHRVLASTGSIFFHCDKTASHIARLLLDEIFGTANFRAEIIWHYRRWSNSARNLLPAHQTILFYSKTDNYKFNTILTDYSPATNVDQILQRRGRDKSNKSVYARDENGNVVYNGTKKGVPLSDVWDIPFLNPKAKERTGYPTQKPFLLLQRIIELASDPGDIVVDPFCGSGTTLVAAQILGRRAIGIDISEEAVTLTRQRLQQPIVSDSNVLKKGLESYRNANETLLSLLNDVPHVPVHRNNGIDALLKATFNGVPIPVRIQRRGESISDAASALYKAARSKQATRMILIAIEDVPTLFSELEITDSVIIVTSVELSIKRLFAKLELEETSSNRTQPDAAKLYR
jgi:site-specific DNA-methyltransferase (adenine-specific)